MVVGQKLKEAEIIEQDSLLLTRNLLPSAIFNISYIRGLFPEKYFNDKSVPALEMKIKKLIPMDAEFRRLIDWMEKGVYYASQKKYLKTLLFCVCETVEGPMIEEYTFSFSYSNSESQVVSMIITGSGNKKEGGTFNCNSTAEITPNQMRSSACKILVQLMRTLDRMPEERTILMKCLYYDDVMPAEQPAEHEPPFFREEEAQNAWTINPLKMEVGNVNSKHLVLAPKVKSVLDPCEDEIQDDELNIGPDSMQRDDYSESDSEVNQSEEDDQYIVVKQQPHEDNMVDEASTQDSVVDEQHMSRIKEWISRRYADTVELSDLLLDFPDISVVLTEGKLKNAHKAKEIMDKLALEGRLPKTRVNPYTINRQKTSSNESTLVKGDIENIDEEGEEGEEGEGEGGEGEEGEGGGEPGQPLAVHRVSAVDDDIVYIGYVDLEKCTDVDMLDDEVLKIVEESPSPFGEFEDLPLDHSFSIFYLQSVGSERFNRIKRRQPWNDFCGLADCAHVFEGRVIHVFILNEAGKRELLGGTGVQLSTCSDGVTLSEKVGKYVEHYGLKGEYTHVFYTILKTGERREISEAIEWDLFEHLVRGVVIVDATTYTYADFEWLAGEELFIDWSPSKDEGKLVPVFILSPENWQRTQSGEIFVNHNLPLEDLARLTSEQLCLHGHGPEIAVAAPPKIVYCTTVEDYEERDLMEKKLPDQTIMKLLDLVLVCWFDPGDAFSWKDGEQVPQ